ncbi:TonB-dependent receptor [Erythrobacter sp. QSSC1-22B]|uniref:TonB-dependent receptor n=1 Tax=Erythrobacter sp. QSSC1-22B TaxID=1860125 RepID=UPI0008057E92|nr:TonB-dependent receptor [Erythrobacter sp. QSSC1-22B]OBX20175.1 TonB-dependent receptor [Erythrobacter sp. QSSC1-22B]
MSRKPTGIALAASRIAVLTTASGLALMAWHPALAQEAPEGDEEETPVSEEPVAEDLIVVTGFRASLESAQNIKRSADTVVDVITAEDIGALADRSVAEALQRVPGVNIGRFEKTSDPDRFSVEGTGVVIRGLPYVRSELNGRDIFSATGGRELSFNDVSPELLGRVEVFKNTTADMVDGGIAGTVNLVTRKPLDNPGLNFAGSIEANYGDLAKEWSPGFSGIISNTWTTGGGSMFGLQLGYAKSELVSRTDASQLQDPCYRDPSLDDPCIRVQAVGSGGFGDVNFDENTFPPPGTVVVPKGGGVRTTDLERDREAFSAVGQFESGDGRLLATVEYLRAETQFFTDEYFIQALVNNDAGFPIERAGTDWTFDESGVFQTGTLTQLLGDSGLSPWGGLPTELARFQRNTEAKTQDISFDAQFEATDRLRFNFELQHISSDLRQDSIIGAMNTFSDLVIDNRGDTPQVQFITPIGAPEGIYDDPAYTYYWFLLDSKARNEGSLDSVRFDVDYDVSDSGFIKRARFGTRWAERDRTTRDTNFQNWGSLGAPWTGRNGNWNCADPQVYGCGGAYPNDFPDASGYRTPFADNFQRGNAPTPIQNGGGYFFGGDDFIGEYLDGTTVAQGEAIAAFAFPEFLPERWTPMADGFTADQISDVEELTAAAYARLDYGLDFDNGWALEGNFGVRYVQTTVKSGGVIALPNPADFDNPANNAGGNGDGIVQVSEIQFSCANNPNPTAQIGYCQLSDARLAQFASAYTGDVIIDGRDITFDHWLPSFNAKLDFGNGLLLRGAVSKGISRPDLSFFRAGGTIADNTGDLLSGGALETGPLFQLFTGNRNVQATQSWNYDLSLEWYFDDVGSFTVAGFVKDLSGIVSSGVNVVEYPTADGAFEVEVNGPSNELGGTLKGVEVAYQQSYDFLPGLLSGFGSQLTYTYVDAGDFSNPDIFGNRSNFASRQPLQGVSKHTVNATLFYEKGPISTRVAYNWRSDFLITPRDDIFPFSPIWQESTGQLDASFFFALTDKIKLGVQGVNLLDEVTRTTQVIDFDGTRLTRSAFRNDRRYTFLARFAF